MAAVGAKGSGISKTQWTSCVVCGCGVAKMIEPFHEIFPSPERVCTMITQDCLPPLVFLTITCATFLPGPMGSKVMSWIVADAVGADAKDGVGRVKWTAAAPTMPVAPNPMTTAIMAARTFAHIIIRSAL